MTAKKPPWHAQDISEHSWGSVFPPEVCHIFCKCIHCNTRGGREEQCHTGDTTGHRASRVWLSPANSEVYMCREMSVYSSKQSLLMSSSKRTLKGCWCVLFTAQADVKRNIFKYTLMLRHIFTCRLKIRKNKTKKSRQWTVLYKAQNPLRKNWWLKGPPIYMNSELRQKHTMYKPCLSRDQSIEYISREIMPVQPNFTRAFRAVTDGLLPHTKDLGQACTNQPKAPLWT